MATGGAVPEGAGAGGEAAGAADDGAGAGEVVAAAFADPAAFPLVTGAAATPVTMSTDRETEPWPTVVVPLLMSFPFR